MSAPPGWHPQPDGRERWWDGQQWTEHFRDPVATPVAPAPYGDPNAQAGTGYGTPGAGFPPPQKQGMSGGAKGCLIAAVVIVVLLVVGVIVGGILFARTASKAVDEVRSAVPTNFPTDLPSAGGDPVTVSVGDGFELPNVTVAGGWRLEDQAGIGKTIEGMTATFSASNATGSVFSMAFAGGEETVCTATPTDGAQTGTVNCIPVFGDVADDAEVTITPTF
ncbi:DUF2510 domain-containing protein [Phycicoccus avicenniae]|uniref:DUF2510 domain-containing protein n=1 Tax=Phycicoccus avicenniae TaxID=2828860 RepID=UPI003D286751